MATVKTIKPDGTGDYTTLQAWEDWADGEATADQHAECYTGGNLGACTVAGWAATPSASVYPYIYTPTSQRHSGVLTDGAYIDTAGAALAVSVKFVRVNGLRIQSASTPVASFTSNDGNVIENCLVYGSSASDVKGIQLRADTTTTVAMTARNNIVYVPSSTVSVATSNGGIYVVSVEISGSTVAPQFEVFNNSVFQPGGQGIVADRFAAIGTVNMTVAARNNFVSATGTRCFYTSRNSGLGSLTLNGSFNAATDTTSDDWGATGAQNSLTASSQVVNEASDWNLKADANLIDAGTDLSASGVTTDYSGITRSGTYDIGADEYVAPAVASDHSNRSGLQLSIWI